MGTGRPIPRGRRPIELQLRSVHAKQEKRAKAKECMVTQTDAAKDQIAKLQEEIRSFEGKIEAMREEDG